MLELGVPSRKLSESLTSFNYIEMDLPVEKRCAPAAQQGHMQPSTLNPDQTVRYYRFERKLEEARKMMLRTFTTGESKRIVYKVGHQSGGFKPVKYFSIDKVYRTET
ncbi:conserved hypothetical protein [Culex quinquefasciatus]|uniref:Phenylalanyl-tRNA synthetase domain-containing protein n=1 Tax=Culex quinquefasciatus TaxID=7176 RepID=B0WMV7_CULQU|nr:conserved hypothetical protein [Culex quinquefasciatus]|eukprot:XP_001850041.1 conserved hypothetical protein [Culex quinquefasciatus]